MTTDTGPRRRVLLVSHYFPPHVGGIEMVAQAESRQLALSGDEVTVLTTAVGGVCGTERTAEGCRVVRLRAWNITERRWRVPFPVLMPTGLLAAWRLVRSADVVHVHDLLYTTTWWTAWCAVVAGKPLVLTQHVHLVAHPRREVELVQQVIYRSIGRLILRRARTICYLNQSVARLLRDLGADGGRLTFLPNGVDQTTFRPPGLGEKQRLRRELGLPADQVLALFVGRFVPKKGYTTVMEAVDDRYVLVFVGGDAPPDRPEDPRCIFLGRRTPAEISEIYRAVDVFVLPSVAEGFPMTVQEAMASGLPIVTSDDPGYAPYGLDRADVALVEPSAASVRAALQRVAGDSSLREAMSAYSLAYARAHFDWTVHARTLDAVYAAGVE